MASPGLLTTGQVADRAKVSPRTIARWAENGRLPVAQRLPGTKGAILFAPADVDALLDDLRAERARLAAI